MDEVNNRYFSSLDNAPTIRLLIFNREELDWMRGLIESARPNKKKKPSSRHDITAPSSICKNGSSDALKSDLVLKLINENINCRPLENILYIARSRWNCEMAILEEPYTDIEFLQFYSQYYSKSHFDFNRRCLRMHFFAKYDFHIEEKLKRGEKIDNDYLGFIVIGPTLTHNMGKCAIRLKTEKLEWNYADGRKVSGKGYLKGAFPNQASILGEQFEVIAVPYMQQDPVLGPCATAAGWVAAQMLYYNFEGNKFHYYRMTELSVGDTFSLGDPLKTEGLTIDEVCKALRSTGANVKVFRNKSALQFKEILYAYCESGIPVVICCSDPKESVGHAVTAVGHFLPDYFECADAQRSEIEEELSIIEPLRKGSQNSRRKFHSVAQWINAFYVHDDRYGPYSRFVLDSEKFINIEKSDLTKKNLQKLLKSLNKRGIKGELALTSIFGSLKKKLEDQRKPQAKNIVLTEFELTQIAEKLVPLNSTQVSSKDLRSLLKIVIANFKSKKDEYTCPARFLRSKTLSEKVNIESLIVAQPSYCRNTPFPLLNAAVTIFESTAKMLELAAKKYPEFQDVGEFADGHHTLRCLLVRSKDFKRTLPKRVLENAQSGHSFIRSIRSINLPQFIWIVECSKLEPGKGRNSQENREVIGTVLFDSTTETQRPRPLFLWYWNICMKTQDYLQRKPVTDQDSPLVVSPFVSAPFSPPSHTLPLMA